ncbi:hypothetical protein Z950_140 [Sulfitobacter mediterraneus KCTC 32188]|nr:hypothetical protein Z950_140 [Sulfitobacter mediterraneus KCTC 32188]
MRNDDVYAGRQHGCEWSISGVPTRSKRLLSALISRRCEID